MVPTIQNIREFIKLLAVRHESRHTYADKPSLRDNENKADVLDLIENSFLL